MPARSPNALSMLLEVAFPSRCLICQRGMQGRSTAESPFCGECEADLATWESPVCHRCATPLANPSAASTTDCPVCRQQNWSFDAVVALGAYEGLLRRVVLEAKRPAGEAALAAVGQLLADRHRDRLMSEPGAVVVPVPQHWTRGIARRGDGVGALATAISASLQVACRRLLQRTRRTPRQTQVAPSARLANVRGAFGVRSAPMEGKTVLLVDDVFTTGSTCHAAAQALKRAGAKRVVAVVAARRIGLL